MINSHEESRVAITRVHELRNKIFDPLSNSTEMIRIEGEISTLLIQVARFRTETSLEAVIDNTGQDLKPSIVPFARLRLVKAVDGIID